MKYRNLGNTGFQVSEIGLGCEGFIDKPFEYYKEAFKLMLDNGVNIIDLYSPHPDLRKNLQKAYMGNRDKIILQSHLCSIFENNQYLRTRDIKKTKDCFELMLKELNTDYIDIGMIHYIDSKDDMEKVLNGEIFQYAKELKKEGKILSIGISSHNPIVSKMAVEKGGIDVLMFSINPCYDVLPPSEDVEELWNENNYKNDLLNIDKDRKELYELCELKGVGITVMKAFGGGDLLKSELSPAKSSLTPYQCISYALSRPAVTSVMAGARSIDEIKSAINYENAKEEDKDYTIALKNFPKISWEGHCMYCGHCAPCPKNIDIALVTKFLNLVKANGFIPETVREHYKLLSSKADSCIKCGACEKRCPFKVQIIKNMEEAKEIFKQC